MSILPHDFTELLPKVAARDPRPAYYLWVWDPDTETLYIDHNEDKHPAHKLTWQSLAPHVGPEAIKGRAIPIEGGWRILTRSGGEADPYLTKHVLKALREKHPPPALPLVGR